MITADPFAGVSPEVDYSLAGAGGDVLLDRVAAAVSRYCILPSPHALTGVVL